MKTLTGAAIAESVGGEASQAVAAQNFSRVSAFENARSDAVVFAEDSPALTSALDSSAGLILARRESCPVQDARLVWVDAPKYAFAVIAGLFNAVEKSSWTHPTASVDGEAHIGKCVRVGARAVIEAGVTLGDFVEVGPGAVVHSGTIVGDRCVIQAGAVLGSTGFGYVRNPSSGEYLLFPQQGTLVLEADVEIGANTTIDRGALGETRIGQGTKIDNLVQVGHNCSIGRNVIIASQVGISGSTVIEDGAVLAGQVGLGDHVRVGAGVVLGGQAGVFPGKTVRGPGELFAGTPAEPVRDYLKSMARVRRLK